MGASVMTDYNDGLWHGWNGGERPVHPKTLVDAIFIREDGTIFRNSPIASAGATAGSWNWNATAKEGPLIAFRVVKPYREPREWWTVGAHMHDTKAKAEGFRLACARNHGDHHMETPIIHVREVTE